MTGPVLDALIDVVLPDGRRVDVLLRGGRIEAIIDHGQPDSPNAVRGRHVVDCGGALLLPAFVDGQCHLDKTFWGAPWQPHRASGSLRERIANERELRARVGVPVTARATALAEHMVTLGTGHVRSHVDIDPDIKLGGLHQLLEVREALRDKLSIQLVAFPQSASSPPRVCPTSSTRRWPRGPT